MGAQSIVECCAIENSVPNVTGLNVDPYLADKEVRLAGHIYRSQFPDQIPIPVSRA